MEKLHKKVHEQLEAVELADIHSNSPAHTINEQQDSEYACVCLNIGGVKCESGIEDLDDMTFNEKQELLNVLALSKEEVTRPESEISSDQNTNAVTDKDDMTQPPDDLVEPDECIDRSSDEDFGKEKLREIVKSSPKLTLGSRQKSVSETSTHSQGFVVDEEITFQYDVESQKTFEETGEELITEKEKEEYCALSTDSSQEKFSQSPELLNRKEEETLNEPAIKRRKIKGRRQKKSKVNKAEQINNDRASVEMEMYEDSIIKQNLCPNPEAPSVVNMEDVSIKTLNKGHIDTVEECTLDVEKIKKKCSELRKQKILPKKSRISRKGDKSPLQVDESKETENIAFDGEGTCDSAIPKRQRKEEGASEECQLKRKYRRRHVANREYKCLFAPVDVDTQVLMTLLDIYHLKLKLVQSKCLRYTQWGDPVKPGKHHQSTVDACKRGQQIYDLINLEVADVSSQFEQDDRTAQESQEGGIPTIPDSEEEEHEFLSLKKDVPSLSPQKMDSPETQNTSPDIFDFFASSSQYSRLNTKRYKRRDKDFNMTRNHQKSLPDFNSVSFDKTDCLTTIPDSDEEVEEILGLKIDGPSISSQMRKLSGTKSASPDIFDFEESSQHISRQHRTRDRKNRDTIPALSKRRIAKKAKVFLQASDEHNIEISSKKEIKSSAPINPNRPNSCPVVSEIKPTLTPSPPVHEKAELRNCSSLSCVPKGVSGMEAVDDVLIVENDFSQQSNHSETSTYSSIINSQGEIYCTQLPSHLRKSRNRRSEKQKKFVGKRSSNDRDTFCDILEADNENVPNSGRTEILGKHLNENPAPNIVSTGYSGNVFTLVDTDDSLEGTKSSNSIGLTGRKNCDIDCVENKKDICVTPDEQQTSNVDECYDSKECSQNSRNKLDHPSRKSEINTSTDDQIDSEPILITDCVSTEFEKPDCVSVIHKNQQISESHSSKVTLDGSEWKSCSRKRGRTKSGNEKNRFMEKKKSKILLVDCPLCSKSFPQNDIETHAAECQGSSQDDGLSLDTEQTTKEIEVEKNLPIDAEKEEFMNTEKEMHSTSRLGSRKPPKRAINRECYVCGREFPEGKLYNGHLKKCLSRATKAQEELDLQEQSRF